ncbi:MAG: hypothetical protein AB9M53_01085 [Leptothrix sp. (in: b-proteobacteria)]
MPHPRQDLTTLHSMSRHIEQSERQILARAEAHLGDLQAKIKKLRGAAMVPGAAEAREYQDAVLDQGKVQIVIAQARRNLGQ